MSTQTRERNARGQGERLRVELVDAARVMLVKPVDHSPLSLRAVARTVGVSPAAVYRHFDSAELLLRAVIDDQVGQLSASMGHLRVEADSAEVAAIAARYVTWGIEHPGAYQLLFESADRLGFAVGPGTQGWHLIDDLVSWLEPRVGQQAAPAVATRAWSGLHGLTSLRIHKSGLPWPASIEAEASELIRTLLA